MRNKLFKLILMLILMLLIMISPCFATTKPYSANHSDYNFMFTNSAADGNTYDFYLCDKGTIISNSKNNTDVKIKAPVVITLKDSDKSLKNWEDVIFVFQNGKLIKINIADKEQTLPNKLDPNIEKAATSLYKNTTSKKAIDDKIAKKHRNQWMTVAVIVVIGMIIGGIKLLYHKGKKKMVSAGYITPDDKITKKKICPRCGSSLQPNDKFCAKCGMAAKPGNDFNVSVTKNDTNNKQATSRFVKSLSGDITPLQEENITLKPINPIASGKAHLQENSNVTASEEFIKSLSREKKDDKE